MEQDTSGLADRERSYQNLLNLWTSAVRDYHSLLSAYLTANSIFVAAIGLLLVRQPFTRIFLVFVFVLSIFGVLITLQMAIVLGRFDALNAFWEWKLRGIERSADWRQLAVFEDFARLKDEKTVLRDDQNKPATFAPGWALRVQRRWWARRAVSFPLFFGIIYGLFLLWSIFQLVGWPKFVM